MQLTELKTARNKNEKKFAYNIQLEKNFVKQNEIKKPRKKTGKKCECKIDVRYWAFTGS